MTIFLLLASLNKKFILDRRDDDGWAVDRTYLGRGIDLFQSLLNIDIYLILLFDNPLLFLVLWSSWYKPIYQKSWTWPSLRDQQNFDANLIQRKKISSCFGNHRRHIQRQCSEEIVDYFHAKQWKPWELLCRGFQIGTKDNIVSWPLNTFKHV